MCHRLEVECDMYLTLPCTKNVHWNVSAGVRKRVTVIGCSISWTCAGAPKAFVSRCEGKWVIDGERVRESVRIERRREGTKELLQQRLDVLHRVRWCLCCGEVCQVRGSKQGKWSDAQIIGDCIGKIQLKITMAVHILNATKRECGKVWNIPSRWWIKERMRYENYNGNLPRASLLHPARGKRRK